MTQAYISEIFPTIQGEGPYTGERQIFVRLAGCPLRCDYCDTPDSLTAQGHPKMSPAHACAEVVRFARGEEIKTVSVTGGEPLAHVAFLKKFLPLVKKEGLRVYLETAGVHPEALRGVIRHVDVVSMDIKLPSATGKNFWKKHEQFLKIAGKKAFVKIVIEQNSKESELDRALSILSRRPTPPKLVLQPVTPIGNIHPPAADTIGSFYERAKARLPEVYVMPQQHKIWGVR